MKILIPLDGSKFSEDILSPAKHLASETDEVYLIHVLDPEAAHTTWKRPPPTTTEVSGVWSPIGSLYSRAELGYGATVETKDQAFDRLHDDAMDYLRHISSAHFDDKARSAVVFNKNVTEAIVGYAKAEKVDFIAMATHGRTGLSKALLGSVAGGLLRSKVAPLYMVRPDSLTGEPETENAETKK